MKAKNVDRDRRKFLATVLATGGAAGVVALAPDGESAEQSAEPDVPSLQPESRGYQRTAHVDEYYRSLRA
jgi:hypothetical protein